MSGMRLSQRRPQGWARWRVTQRPKATTIQPTTLRASSMPSKRGSMWWRMWSSATTRLSHATWRITLTFTAPWRRGMRRPERSRDELRSSQGERANEQYFAQNVFEGHGSGCGGGHYGGWTIVRQAGRPAHRPATLQRARASAQRLYRDTGQGARRGLHGGRGGGLLRSYGGGVPARDRPGRAALRQYPSPAERAQAPAGRTDRVWARAGARLYRLLFIDAPRPHAQGPADSGRLALGGGGVQSHRRKGEGRGHGLRRS